MFTGGIILAIGFSTTNPNIRVDTLFHQLHYPQRPLFRTMISDCLGKPGYLFGHNAVLPKPDLFNGQNAIVAVNVHLGYNQADSLVMKRASLERGMFRSEHIRSYKAKVDNKELTDKRRKSEDSITFGKIQSKIGLVDSLNDDGFPFIGANMQSGDIMIGKCAESGTDHSSELPASLPLLHRWINLKFGHVVRLSVIHVLNGGDENGTLQQGDMDA
uniref:DNA-directed RNA polymerase n=1 Tax=Salix viminalis TaxID=40686 RepID=A0A6N2MTF5_SALVM